MNLRIVYMGTPDFAVPALTSLAESDHQVVAVVSQPDRPSGRRLRTKPTPVHAEAERLSIPVHQPEKLRTGAFADWLSAQKPDVIVTAAYGRILTQEILDIPKYGCLNIHASMLPAYRGASPINACIMKGETTSGISIMLMDAGMDTGDLLYQEAVPVPEDMDAGTLSAVLSKLGAERIVYVVENWIAGKTIPCPQNHDAATYTRPMSKTDGEIQWDQSARVVHNLIRGTSPWPGAYTYLDGKRVKIHQSRIASCPLNGTDVPDADPGTIVETGLSAIRVACGEDSCLEILSLQAEACKRLGVEECFHNFRPGQVFDKE